MNEYNLMQILDLVILNYGKAVTGGLKYKPSNRVWHGIRLEWIKDDCWALVELYILLSAIPVHWALHSFIELTAILFLHLQICNIIYTSELWLISNLILC